MKNFLLSALLILFSQSVFSDETTVRSAIQKVVPSTKIDSVVPSAMKGLYEVIVGTSIYYVSDDGKFLIQGRMIDLTQKRDLTEEKIASIRKSTLAKISPEQMISFKPEDEKYNVFIFTDIDCGYCRKLHSEIDQYLAEGISINYLFFPRAGKGSNSYKKAVSVWCSDDRNATLTAAKQSKDPEQKTCDNPVDEHMQLGVVFEVRGTPMIVTEEGNVFPGYVPAKKLAELLREEKRL